jgi:hypothetical protein
MEGLSVSIKKAAQSDADQSLRFKKMAKELQADESPHALDRAFARLDTKKKIESRQPARRKAKQK